MISTAGKKHFIVREEGRAETGKETEGGHHRSYKPVLFMRLQRVQDNIKSNRQAEHLQRPLALRPWDAERCRKYGRSSHRNESLKGV